MLFTILLGICLKCDYKWLYIVVVDFNHRKSSWSSNFHYIKTTSSVILIFQRLVLNNKTTTSSILSVLDLQYGFTRDGFSKNLNKNKIRKLGSEIFFHGRLYLLHDLINRHKNRTGTVSEIWSTSILSVVWIELVLTWTNHSFAKQNNLCFYQWFIEKTVRESSVINTVIKIWWVAFVRMMICFSHRFSAVGVRSCSFSRVCMKLLLDVCWIFSIRNYFTALRLPV